MDSAAFITSIAPPSFSLRRSPPMKPMTLPSFSLNSDRRSSASLSWSAIIPSSSSSSWPLSLSSSSSSPLRTNQKRWRQQRRHVDYNDDDGDDDFSDTLRLFAAASSSLLSEEEDGELFSARSKKHLTDDDDNDEAITTILKQENEALRKKVMLLQQQNDKLGKRQRSIYTATKERPPRIVIENFEEESSFFQLKLRSKVVAGTNNNDDDDDDDEDDDDDDQCIFDEQTNSWICPIEPNISFIAALHSRATWLVGLLALQSCSGFILSNNEELLQKHPVIIYFLTMLVGAGGNAGNQASVRVIRGLALGTLTTTTTSTTSTTSAAIEIVETRNRFLLRELRMAMALSLIMAIAGYIRASVFHTPLPETLAITLALIVIVFTSVCLGAILPLILQYVGIDPAHSSTTIQVVMDILGGKKISNIYY